MKKPIIILVGLLISCILIPVLISSILYKDFEENNSNNFIGNLIKKTIEKNYDKVDKPSPIIKVYNADTSNVEYMDLETYLYGVLSMEMSSEFNEEALKAQAVAARTYVIYKQENNMTDGHNGAYVCTDYNHCQAYASYNKLKETKGDDWIKNSYPKIKSAVDKTKGQILTYDKKAVLPLYFSTSSGTTENSEEVFKTNYPYLRSVSSPYEEESPKYYTTCDFTKKEFINFIKASYPSINLSESNLSSQIKIKDRTEGGSVKTVIIGDKELTGRDIRSIFSLNSSNFDISIDSDKVTFDVKGYGHGVGMSQWGAEGMAKNGYKYYDILFHYYKDTDIKDTY